MQDGCAELMQPGERVSISDSTPSLARCDSLPRTPAGIATRRSCRPRLTAQDKDPAVTRPHILHQPIQAAHSSRRPRSRGPGSASRHRHHRARQPLQAAQLRQPRAGSAGTCGRSGRLEPRSPQWIRMSIDHLNCSAACAASLPGREPTSRVRSLGAPSSSAEVHVGRPGRYRGSSRRAGWTGGTPARPSGSPA